MGGGEGGDREMQLQLGWINRRMESDPNAIRYQRTEPIRFGTEKLDLLS